MQSISIQFIFDRKGETKKDPSQKAPIEILVYDKATQKKIYI